MAASAWARVAQMATPLPAANPSALIATGNLKRPRAAMASAGSSNASARAVGTPAARMIFLAKTLLPSSRAAAREGPKTGSPSAAQASTMPAQSGASGPTTIKSGRLALAQSVTAATSSAASGRLRASAAVPALPGAQKIS